MKRTKLTAAAVALALAFTSSAFAVGTGKGKGKEDTSRTSGGKAKTAEQRTAELSRANVLIGDISNGMKVQNVEIKGVKINNEDIPALNKITAEAFVDGLFGVQQTRLFNEIKANPGKAEFVAIWANIQLMASKKLLTTENLEWTEVIDGVSHKVNSMDFINGEALAIAKGSSPKFVQFMNIKTALENDGLSTREAITKALEQVGISLKEFVMKCLVK